MIFLNFLCLFYLMVLINGHTISKSITKNDISDNIFETLNDYDNPVDSRQKHDTLHHNFRREDVHETKNLEPEVKNVNTKIETSEISLKPSTVTKAQKKATRKSTKVTQGFWRRFHNKFKDKKSKTTIGSDSIRRQRLIHKKRILLRTTDIDEFYHASESPEFNNNFGNKNSFRNRRNLNENRRKNLKTKRLAKDEVIHIGNEKTTKVATENEIDYDSEKDTKTYANKDLYLPTMNGFVNSTVNPVSAKRLAPNMDSNNITKLISTMTTKVTRLKQKYGLNDPTNKQKTTTYKQFTPTHRKHHYNQETTADTSKELFFNKEPVSTVTTVDERDFIGTAQIEALLDEIKMKAIQMVAEQSPAISDIITNTVTEATFEADPIITHLDIGSPGYALSTFISVRDANNVYEKRTPDTTDTTAPVTNAENVIISVIEPTHSINIRSFKEDAITMAQNVEDILQGQLKKMYHKVKNKVSKDYHKEVKEAKSTLKKGTSKMIKKISHATKASLKNHHKSSVTTTKMTTSRQNRFSAAPAVKFYGKTKTQKLFNTQKTTTPGLDDYAMLTLYEELLTKTHESNIMKMLSTQELPISKIKLTRDNFRLSKRNPETITNINLKENIKKLYDDDEIMPGDPLPFETETKSSVNVPKATEFSQSTTIKDSTIKNQADDDSSFEGLTNKIAYNDYVNGYKYYLNFQREQAHENFSNLVRYQAHRHHNVNDIGKFILNRIPQLPSTNRYKRKIFDDSETVEEQDTSTKSDESWFKKHFYLFIDTGLPKKYHTAQRVSLKSPITRKSGVTTTDRDVPNSTKVINRRLDNDDSRIRDDEKQEEDVSLEELTKILEGYKENNLQTKEMPLNDDISQEIPERIVVDKGKLKIIEPTQENMLQSLISGIKSKKKAKKTMIDMFKYDDINDSDILESLLEEELNRSRKHIKKDDSDGIHPINLPKEFAKNSTPLNSLLSVATKSKKNYGYVNVNLVPKPTATVRLKEKESKMKKFFKKLRFHKKPKDMKPRIKKREEQNRIHRSSPLKILRDMFKISSNNVNATPRSGSDYDVLTSHIDSFKPIKYDKVPSMEEMKAELPNVNDDFSISKPLPPEYDSKKILKDLQFDQFQNQWQQKQDLPFNPDLYFKPKDFSTKTFSLLSGPDLSRKYSNLENKEVENKNNFAKDLANNLININIKTLAEPSGGSLNEDNDMLFTPHMGADMKNELEMMQHKLTRYKSNLLTRKAIATSTAKYRNDHLKNKILLVPITDKPTKEPIKIENRFNNDFGTQNKLTKIDKNPISNFRDDMEDFGTNTVSNKPQIYEPPIDSHTNILESIENGADTTERIQYKPTNPFLLLSRGKYETLDDVSKYRTYPDYFRDLLNWHSDILNSDKVDPSWDESVSKVNSEVETMAPSVQDFQTELSNLTNYSKYHSITSTEATTNGAFPEIQESNDNIGFSSTDIPQVVHLIRLPSAIAKDSKYIQLIYPIPTENIKDFGYDNDLNKVHLKLPTDKHKIAKFYDQKQNDGNLQNLNGNPVSTLVPSSIYIDTTLLAYDDGFNYFTDSFETKKSYRNSFETTKNGKVTAPHAIMNTPPKQYFTTPLPMKKYDFEKFLKENELDVQSVTSPLLELPKFTWQSIKEPTKATPRKQDKTVTKPKPKSVTTETTPKLTTLTPKVNILKPAAENNDYPDYMIEVIDQLQSDLHNEEIINDDKDIKRSKRNWNYSNKTDDYFQNSDYSDAYIESILNKYKRTHLDESLPNNLQREFSKTTTNDAINNNNNKAIDLTIINFDEYNKIQDQKQKSQILNNINSHSKTVKTVAMNTDKLTNIMKTTKRTKPKNKFSLGKVQSHANIEPSYTTKGSKKTEKTTETTLENPFRLSHMFNNEPVKENNTRSFTMRIPELTKQLFKKYPDAKPDGSPKRLQVFHNTYKYDIVYHDPHRSAMFTTPSDDTIPVMNVREYNDSEEREIIKVVKVLEAVENFTVSNKIHIDLPTYDLPNTEITSEADIETSTKSMWNDYILKYISGIALLEMLSKFGILKDVLTFTDGFDKAVNACKVFSAREFNVAKRIISNTEDVKKRFARKAKSSTSKQSERDIQASFVQSNDHVKPVTYMNSNKRRRRLFKILPLLRRKLKSSIEDTTLLPELNTRPMPSTNPTHLSPDMSTTSSNSNESVKKDKITNLDKHEKVFEPKRIEKTKVEVDVPLKLDTKQELKETTTAAKQSTKIDKSNKPLTTILNKQKKGNKKVTSKSDEVYVEKIADYSEVYFEPRAKLDKDTKKQTSTASGSQTPKKEKRDISESFTAKDVAAIEVIVDLMKNTASFDSRDIQAFNDGFNREQYAIMPSTSKGIVSNAIQVHIAVPCTIQCDKKRSVDPLRVRKVFSAILSTPVDLQYQIHDFEDKVEFTTANLIENLSPGLYLVVENKSNGMSGNIALKPIKGRVSISDLKARQADSFPKTEEVGANQKVETTSPGKSLTKVTLSKDFVAAVNKHLIQLYENLTTLNNTDNRLTSSETNETKPDLLKNSRLKQRIRRHIKWDAIKKFFGHDRVCDCHCKPNKTMCRACAASDAVISELIFEFDNLGRYMSDHCTEIQTYFWMNPSGGRKLRDSVHRIDKSLDNYFKRIRGKCQGRTCKTFSSYLEKRVAEPIKIDKNYIGDALINDVKILASDLKHALKRKICFEPKLKEVCQSFIKTAEDCISMKYVDKRADFKPEKSKYVKSVYSLDNINVNIICKTDSTKLYSSSIPEERTASSSKFDILSEPSNIFDYDTDATKKSKESRKGIKSFFHIKPSKKKNVKRLSTFYENTENVKGTTTKFTVKRQVKMPSQIESPLLTDTSGSFWYDYINKGNTEEPRIVREATKFQTQNKSKDKTKCKVNSRTTKVHDNTFSITPEISINILTNTVKSSNKKSQNVILSVSTTTPRIRLVQRFENTTDVTDIDSLSYSINEFMKLFGSLSDVGEIQNATDFSSTPKTTKKTTKHKNKVKSTKQKTHKSSKAKVKTDHIKKQKQNKHSSNKTPFTGTSSISIKTNTSPAPATVTNLTTQIYKSSVTLNAFATVETTKSSTKSNFLKKIKFAPFEFFNKFNKSRKETTTEKESRFRRLNADESMFTETMSVPSSVLTLLVNTSSTTRKNPTIVIINDGNTESFKDNGMENIGVDRNSNEDNRSLLLSILKYESDRINDEYEKFSHEVNSLDQMSSDPENNMEDLGNTIIELKSNTKSQSSPGSPKNYSSGNYDIIKDLKSLLAPLPQKNSENLTEQGFLDQITDKLAYKVVTDPREKKKAASKYHRNTLTPKLQMKKTQVTRQGTNQDQRSTEIKLKDTTNGNNGVTHIIPKKTQQSVNHQGSKVSPNTLTNPPAIQKYSKTACESPSSESKRLCDIHATVEHVIDVYRYTSNKDFEGYVKNITCYKYIRAPKNFHLRPWISKKKSKEFNTRKPVKFDWIRNKRSILARKLFKKGVKNINDNINYRYDVAYNVIDEDYFEKLYKDKDGIYRRREEKRRKRKTADLKELFVGIRNLPLVRPEQNEIYAMPGDSVVIDCVPTTPSKLIDPSVLVQEKYMWKCDRPSMLSYKNVEVGAHTLMIRDVQSKNFGKYVCMEGPTEVRNVQLTVITIPTFNVVFTPVYAAESECNYKDLRVLRGLGQAMCEEAGSCDKHWSIRIDEPICLRDKNASRSLVRVTAVMSASHPEVTCSNQCRRDLQASLALLCASNAPTLAAVGVLVHRGEAVKKFTPTFKTDKKWLVTHTLRKKDSNRHLEYHQLASKMTPRDLDVLVSCPAGYYLMSKQKICATCPPNTYSLAGDNVCSVCGRGTGSPPGAGGCRLSQTRQRRYDWWWWYPPCGYVVGLVAMMAACCMAAACAALADRAPRSRNATASVATCLKDTTIAQKPSPSSQPHSPRRPLSPSRVILARLFRGSASSSRATDSQENKLNFWRKGPPPLPPIDFDSSCN